MSAVRRENQAQDKDNFLRALEEELPPFIARTQVETALGGIVSCKTLANADSKGTGPEVAYAVGQKIVYSRSALVKWLADNFPISRQQA